MKFRIRHADQVVGAFIVLAVLAMVAASVFIGLNQRWFAKNYYFKAEFASASNLSPGTAIHFKGFTIGKIARTRLNDRNTVDVDFYIYDTYYDKVREFSLLELSVSPIGLGSSLNFYEGKGESVLPEGSFIQRADSEAGQAIADIGMADIPPKDDTISRVLANVSPLLENANKVMVNLNKTLAEVNGSLRGEGTGPLTRTLQGASSSVESLRAVLADVSAELPGIMSGLSAVADNAKRITGDLQGTTSALKDPTGLVPRLLGPGSVSSLITDQNALYDKVTGMVAKVNAALASVADMTGRLDSEMPNISIMLEDTKATLKKAQDVLEALRNNPLLKGGVPAAKDQESLIRSARDKEF